MDKIEDLVKQTTEMIIAQLGDAGYIEEEALNYEAGYEHVYKLISDPINEAVQKIFGIKE